MTFSDYLEHVVVTGFGRYKVGSATRHGGLSARSSSTAMIWAGLDFLCAFVGGLLAFHIRQHADHVPVSGGFFTGLWLNVPFISVGYLFLFSVYLVFFARMYGLYGVPESRSALNEQRMTIQAVLTAGLLLCGTLYLTKAYAVSRIVVALTLILTMCALMTRRAIWRRVRQQRFLDGSVVRNVLIVGEGRVGQALRSHLQSLTYMGFQFKGFVSVDGPSDPSAHPEIVSDVQNCVAIARSLFVDEIYFAAPAPKEMVFAVVEEARANDIDVRVVPDLYDGLAWNAPVEYVGQFPTIPLYRRDFPRGAFVLKSVTDFVFCCAALVALSPLILIVALLIKVSSPGPIFYRAKRVGRKGRHFTCYKFRTMVVEADKMRKHLEHRNEREGLLFKISDDPRITRVGAWLRKYSLDELPQLFNVVSGDMSLVGPRPPLTSEVERYDLAHLRRLDVLPGITGLWQVEARQDPSFDQYISLDTAYVENWSLLLDLKIMAKTIGVVFSGTGT
jgi:exopolysaccharide biosynthesis polyprenyl glycosylphosphotransferase